MEDIQLKINILISSIESTEKLEQFNKTTQYKNPDNFVNRLENEKSMLAVLKKDYPEYFI